MPKNIENNLSLISKLVKVYVKTLFYFLHSTKTAFQCYFLMSVSFSGPSVASSFPFNICAIKYYILACI